jgi:protein LTV1
MQAQGESKSVSESSSGEEDGAGSAAHDDGGASVAFSLATTTRHKGETAEERKARKAAAKEVRRGSRAAKKELKGLFKAEAGRQKRQAAGKQAAGGGSGSTFVIA